MSVFCKVPEVPRLTASVLPCPAAGPAFCPFSERISFPKAPYFLFHEVSPCTIRALGGGDQVLSLVSLLHHTQVEVQPAWFLSLLLHHSFANLFYSFSISCRRIALSKKLGLQPFTSTGSFSWQHKQSPHPVDLMQIPTVAPAALHSLSLYTDGV